jgi:hypothetical protein
VGEPVIISRERDASGVLRLSAGDCRYAIARLRPGVILMVIAGRETGALGRAPLGEVAAEAALVSPLCLCVDMSAVSSIDEAVSDDWTAWLQANRSALRSVHALAPAAIVRVTVAVSQLFSRTGDLIRIHTERDRFAAAVHAMAPDADLAPFAPS